MVPLGFIVLLEFSAMLYMLLDVLLEAVFLPLALDCGRLGLLLRRLRPLVLFFSEVLN